MDYTDPRVMDNTKEISEKLETIMSSKGKCKINRIYY